MISTNRFYINHILYRLHISSVARILILGLLLALSWTTHPWATLLMDLQRKMKSLIKIVYFRFLSMMTTHTICDDSVIFFSDKKKEFTGLPQQQWGWSAIFSHQ